MKPIRLLALALSLAAVGHASTFTFKPLDTFSGGDSNHYDLNDLEHGYAYTWGITSTIPGSTPYSTLKRQLSSGAYAITSATITISDIYNWDKRDTTNQLFIHLLDNPLTGVKQVADNPTDGGINQGVVSDYFSGPISGNKVDGKWLTYGYQNTASNKAAKLILDGATTPGPTTSATNTYLTQYHDADGPTTSITLTYNFTATQLSVLKTYVTNITIGGSSYADFGLGFDPDCHFYNNGVKFVINTEFRSLPESGSMAALLATGLLALGGLRYVRSRKSAR